MLKASSIKGNALWAFMGGIAFSALLAAGGLWYFNRALSSGFESYLRQNITGGPGKVSFKKAGVDLLRHRFYIDGLELRGGSGEGARWTVAIDEASLQVPLSSLGSGKLEGAKIAIDKPLWSVFFSSAGNRAEPEAAAPGAMAAWPWLRKMSIRDFSLSQGSLHLEYAGGGQPIDVRDIAVTARLDAAEESNTSIHMEGRLKSDSRVSLAVNAKVYQPVPQAGFEGEVRLNDFPISALGNFFPPDPDIAYKDGRLTINTQFNCKKDWLTASHLVEIKNFKVDVSPKRDELLGVSTKYLQELFNIEHLSFVLPMTGSLEDPHIGVSSSVQQILLKILEDKFKDRDKAEKWAKWGGDRFGGKIDRVLKDWVQEKRRSGR